MKKTNVKMFLSKFLRFKMNLSTTIYLMQEMHELSYHLIISLTILLWGVSVF